MKYMFLNFELKFFKAYGGKEDFFPMSKQWVMMKSVSYVYFFLLKTTESVLLVNCCVDILEYKFQNNIHLYNTILS